MKYLVRFWLYKNFVRNIIVTARNKTQAKKWARDETGMHSKEYELTVEKV